MKKVVIALLALALLSAGAVVGYSSWNGNGTGRTYRFVTIERGTVESVVSCTGTLQPTTTVEVGTQVSGIISSIHADFNDRVRKGQIIAVIDTTILATSVREATASLERAQAQLTYALQELERVSALHKRGMVSESDYNQAQYNASVARAQVKSARISLEKAERNLSYATIYAPISGTIINRNVDVGQTVAASLSAPQIFLIAKDLSHMQIQASVDESDIGRIKTGQVARFKVQAYPDSSFQGVVRQVRLQASTTEGVVNYIVVADVENANGCLLPGMTATVDFIIQTASNVLKIPNSALRFRATSDMMAEMAANRPPPGPGSPPDSMRSRGRRMRSASAMSGRSSSTKSSSTARLWYVDADGKLGVARVQTGITDGKSTEIRGRRISEGMKAIAGVLSGTSSSESSSASNPFQSSERRRFGPPRGGF